MRNSSKFLKILLLFFLSLLFAVFISFVFAIWHAYPRGVDATVHALKIFWIAKFFPHHNWWNIWAGGMPHFQFYPVGPNIIMAFLVKIFSLSPEIVLTTVTVLSMGLAGFFVALLVYNYSKSFFVALLVSFIIVSTPSMWDSAVLFGSYIRMIAVPFLVASLYFGLKLAYEPKKKKYLFWLVLFLTLSLSVHTIIGFRAIGLTILLLLLLVKDLKEKLSIVAKTILLFVLASSYYLVPLFVFSPRASFSLADVAFTLDRYRFYKLKEIAGFSQGSVLDPRSFLSSTLFVFPLLIFLLFVALFVNRKIFKEKFLWFFVIGAFGFLLFSSVKIYPLEKLYLVGGGVHSLFHQAIIFAVISVGLFIGRLLGKFTNFVAASLIAALIIWLWVSFSPNPQAWRESVFPKIEGYAREEGFKSLEVPENAQFRFGTGPDANLAMMFNRYYPDYPQTRDYFAKGVINGDSNFYFIKAIWDWDNNLEETKFLLDWWAVDKFVVGTDNENFAKFDSFKLIGKLSQTVRVFEFGQPPPIFSSANTPAVLFIGSWENYMVFFHALAQANINSQKMIPIYLGKDGLHDLKLSELKRFPTVFIYDVELDDEDGQKVLKNYIEEGGSLFIEGPRQEISDLPQFFPMKNVKRNEARGDWDLVQQNYDFDVDFENFSPPIFEEGPWGVATAKNLSSWGKVLISESGKAIMVEGSLGKGKVIWSGMNLPYHIATYKNREESLFLKAIFDWLRNDKGIARTDFKVEFVHPEKRIIKLDNSAKGVLFKEVNFPKWRAYLEKDGKRNKLDIYTAGPDFMYIPLSDANSGDSLILEYKKTSVDYIASFISLFTFFTLTLWVFDWWKFRPLVASFVSSLKKPFEHLSIWWNRE